MRRWWQRLREALGAGTGPSRPDRAREGAPGAFSPPELSPPPGPPAAGAPPGPRTLVEALAHPDPNVRAAAARKLGELGPQHAGLAVPALTGALSDPDEAVRSSAALSLGAFGAGAAPAVPALIEALGDPDDDVRSSAGIALEDIGPPARGALEGALGHANALIRAEAAILLRQLGADRGEP